MNVDMAVASVGAKKGVDGRRQTGRRTAAAWKTQKKTRVYASGVKNL